MFNDLEAGQHLDVAFFTQTLLHLEHLRAATCLAHLAHEQSVTCAVLQLVTLLLHLNSDTRSIAIVTNGAVAREWGVGKDDINEILGGIVRTNPARYFADVWAFIAWLFKVVSHLFPEN